MSLAAAPGPVPVLYAGLLRNGIYKSVNGGRTWRSVTNFPVLAGEAITTHPVSIVSLAVDPQRVGTVYAGTSFSGLLVTTDGGSSWRSANATLAGKSPGPLGDLFSVDAIAAFPMRPARIYAGIRSRGVFASSDGGLTWAATTPLPATDIHAIAIDPHHADLIYVGTLGAGVLRSSDGGRHWRAINRGLANRIVVTLEVDPNRTSVVYAGTYSGVFKSSDRGTTWAPSGSGPLRSALVEDILVHPERPSTVYAATRGTGVFESVDGGASWHPFDAGLPDRLVTALAISSEPPWTLYAGTSRRVAARTLPDRAPSGDHPDVRPERCDREPERGVERDELAARQGSHGN